MRIQINTPSIPITAEQRKTDTPFANLLTSEVFRRFSKTLTDLTGMAINLMSPSGQCFNVPGVPGSQNPLCDRIGTTSKGAIRCVGCDLVHSREAIKKGKPLLYVCHAGFLDIIVPIFWSGVYVASFSTGQILPEPHSDKGFKIFKKRLAWMNLDDSALRRDYNRAPHLPRKQMMRVMDLLQIFAAHLLETSSTIRTLERRLEREDIRKAKDYAVEHALNPHLSLTATAAAAGVSPTHFSRIFKKKTGCPFTHHVQKLRIAHAKQLLLETEKSVSEVCFESGFNSLAHFVRVFKTHELKTPKSYRASATAYRQTSSARRPL